MIAAIALLFASEIKALFASDLIRPEANEPALPEVLSTRYTSGSDTLFRGIHKLLPGHLLVFEHGRVTTKQYWDVPTRQPSAIGHQPSAVSHQPSAISHEVVSEFRALLEESVRLRLMSDVPLGMFLSGGIDLSLIHI